MRQLPSELQESLPPVNTYRLLRLFSGWPAVVALALTLPLSARAQEVHVGNYHVVSQTRVGRTAFDYVLKADLANPSPLNVKVLATLRPPGIPSVAVIDGDLTFGLTAAGQA